MLAREITTFCIFWQLFHLSRCGIAHLKYSKLKAMNWGLPLAGHKHNVTPIATSKVTDHMNCMVQCGRNEGCVAINIGPRLQGQDRKCEMLDNTRYSVSNFMNFTAQPGWTYIGLKTKCDANPCPKELLCIPQLDDSDYICSDINGESCRAPLGMESGDILDNAITSSSDWDRYLYSFFARLNTVRQACAWCAREMNNQWIQVDLGFITAVTGVATQGRCDPRHPQWTTSYMVSYSTDAHYWKFCEEFGNEKIFAGNSDTTTVVTHFFQTPISARYVRLWPQSYRSRPSLRIELYGC